MLNNQDFTHNRATFIGGSDIGAILGVSKFRSPMEVWLEKTGKKQFEQPSFAMRFGTFAEAFIADEYARQTGSTLAPQTKELSHPSYAFCQGHIDRFVLNDPQKPLYEDKGELNSKRLLECKTASQFMQGAWGDVGSDQIPLPYLCQCLWYLGIAQIESIDVAVLIGGSDLRIYTIARDTELEVLLFERANYFWTEYVQKDKPPPAISESDCVHLFAKGEPGKTMEANDETLQLVRHLHALEQNAKQLDEKISQTKQALMQTMQEAEALTYADKTLITWKSPKPSYRIDTKRLSQDHPDLIKQYEMLIACTRRFTLRDVTALNSIDSNRN